MPNEQDYKKTIYLNLVDAYGDQVPDENTFYTKMNNAEYRKIIHANLIDAYGDQTPDYNTFESKYLKKKAVSQGSSTPVTQPTKPSTPNTTTKTSGNVGGAAVSSGVKNAIKNSVPQVSINKSGYVDMNPSTQSNAPVYMGRTEIPMADLSSESLAKNKAEKEKQRIEELNRIYRTNKPNSIPSLDVTGYNPYTMPERPLTNEQKANMPEFYSEFELTGENGEKTKYYLLKQSPYGTTYANQTGQTLERAKYYNLPQNQTTINKREEVSPIKKWGVSIWDNTVGGNLAKVQSIPTLENIAMQYKYNPEVWKATTNLSDEDRILAINSEYKNELKNWETRYGTINADGSIEDNGMYVNENWLGRTSAELLGFALDPVTIATMGLGGTVAAGGGKIVGEYIINQSLKQGIKQTAKTYLAQGLSEEMVNKSLTEGLKWYVKKAPVIMERMAYTGGALGSVSAVNDVISQAEQYKIQTGDEFDYADWNAAQTLKSFGVNAVVGSTLAPISALGTRGVQLVDDAFMSNSLKVMSKAGIRVADIAGEITMFGVVNPILMGEKPTKETFGEALTMVLGFKAIGAIQNPQNTISGFKNLYKSGKFTIGEGVYNVEFTPEQLMELNMDNSVTAINVFKDSPIKMKEVLLDPNVSRLTKEKLLWGTRGVMSKNMPSYYDVKTDGNIIKLYSKDGELLEQIFAKDELDAQSRAASLLDPIKELRTFDSFYSLGLEDRKSIVEEMNIAGIPFSEYETALLTPKRERTDEQNTIVNSYSNKINSYNPKVEITDINKDLMDLSEDIKKQETIDAKTDGVNEVVSDAVKNPKPLQEDTTDKSKILGNAIQEPTTTENVSRTGETGGNISKGSEGIGQEVKGETITEEGKKIGVKHEELDKQRAELGLDERTKWTPISVQESLIEAEKAIKNGYDTNKLIERVNNGEALNNTEQAILGKKAATLDYELSQIKDTSSKEFNDKLEEVSKVTNALSTLGSRTGSTLAQRKSMFIDVDDTLSGYFNKAIEDNKFAPLTEKQKADVKAEFENIEKAKAEFEAWRDKEEQRIAKLKAEKVIRVTGTKDGVKKTHADFKADRDKLRSSIADKLKASRSSIQSNAIPYLNDLIAISPEVIALAKSYVHEGIVGIDGIVKKIHPELKKYISDIQERDVIDIIAGKYNEKRQPKSEIQKNIFEMQQEFKAASKLQSLLDGVEPKSEKQLIKHNQRIFELRQQIKENDLTKLANYKNSIKRRIDELDTKLKNGDYEKDTTKPKPLELDAEGRALKYKYLRLKQERDIKRLNAEYRNRNTWQKIRDTALDLVNMPRTLMSSMDFSAPLRQGLWASVSNPKVAAKSFVKMFEFAGSQKEFTLWFEGIKEDPRYIIAKEAKLYIADTNNPLLTKREEQFTSALVEKIPILGTKLIKGSERAYTGYLNKMRWDLFNQFADMYESKGLTYDNSPKLYKDIADYINNSTGRGSLGFAENAAPAFSAIFFAPRLIASRVKMLTNWANPSFYTNTSKQVRVQYFKDAAKLIGVGMTILALAKLNGAEVEDDPTSSDFGKIKYGNTRWDIWGGHQQYVRLMAVLFSKFSGMYGDDKVRKNANDKFGSTPGDITMRFVRGKLAPIPATITDVFVGKNIVGEPVTMEDELLGKMPLITGDIQDAYKDGGVKKALGVGIPATFGVGVQTYNSNSGSGYSGGRGGRGGR